MESGCALTREFPACVIVIVIYGGKIIVVVCEMARVEMV